jgi:hypothetical protein
VNNRERLFHEVMHSAERLLNHRNGDVPITKQKYPAMWSSFQPVA